MAATPATSEPSVPLAVWPCAQTTAQWQRAGRYLPDSSQHPGKMLPELARRIVAEFSAAGDLVVDPMCGIGTTLVEAAALDRRALGVELERRWADLARENITHAVPAGQRHLARVRVGDARRLPVVLADIAGEVDLVATSPPYACDVANVDRAAKRAHANLRDTTTLNYSDDRSNLGHARGSRYLAEMAHAYAACFPVLRPGGHLVTVTKNLRRRGRLFDLAAATVALAQDAGFGYVQHVISLLAAVSDSDLVGRPSFWQRLQVGKARARGEPVHLVCHEDVLVFAKPEAGHGL